MRIGNVIQSPCGGIWIVTDVHDDVVCAVSFDSENCSAGQRLDDHERMETCGDCYDYPNEECETCHGQRDYKKPIVGWKHAKVLAPTVRDYIMQGVRKLWQL